MCEETVIVKDGEVVITKPPEYIQSMGTLTIKPGDTIILKLSRPVPDHARSGLETFIKEQLQADNRVIVLGPEFDIGVIRKEG